MSDSSKQRILPSVLKVLSGLGGGGDDADVRVSQRARQSFKSLDRSLKSFLKSSNLPGLEYRLRLSGYNALSDLLDADVDTLCAHGFTPIMARRLLRALDEYVIGSLNQSPQPFQLVRQGQRISSDPTDKMKALPTYGKQNVKRQRFVISPKMSKKRSSGKGSKVKPTNPKRPMSYVRLMSEENLPSEPIFRNELPGGLGAAEEASGRDSRESVEEVAISEELRGSEDELTVNVEFHAAVSGLEETAAAAAGNSEDEAVAHASQSTTVAAVTGSSGGDETNQDTRVDRDPSPLPVVGGSPGLSVAGRGRGGGVGGDWRRSVPVFQEFFMPDAIDTGERWAGMGRRLKRCSSVPADFRFHSSADAGATTPAAAAAHQPWCMLVRSYSCPASLALPPSQIESTLIKLSTSQELPEIESSLRLLCSLAKGSEVSRKDMRESGGLEVVVDLLVSLCTHPRVVSRCFKLIKFLTREVMLEGVVPAESVTAVLQAMDCHPASEKTLIQGCLALGNIGRAAPSQCEQLMSDRALPTLAVVMETFPHSPALQVSAMSALAVGLGCWPEGRLHLLAQHGRLLDLVLQAMEGFPHHPQLQEYACSFLALLMAEIAVEMESGVVQLMVEHVCIAMATHSEDAQLAVWSGKALANASANAALGDSKLCGRCCDLLTEGLATFSGDAAVWTWTLYALLNLTSSNRSCKEDLLRGGVVSQLKTPPPNLSDPGEQYLEQLLATLVL